MRDERGDECRFCYADRLGMLSGPGGVLVLDGLPESKLVREQDSPPMRRFAPLRRGILRVARRAEAHASAMLA